MNTHPIHGRLPSFLQTLKHLDSDGFHDAFVNEVIETGGTLTGPDADTNCSHMVEIHLHGVIAYGASEPEAMHLWAKTAQAHADLIEDDGFITVHPPFPTPRNHAEEIANARQSLTAPEARA